MLRYTKPLPGHPKGFLRDSCELDRFRQPERASVADLMASSPRLADLARTFPGLLVEVARMPPGERRLRLLRAVEAGEPLRTVARDADLPYWLHRLPPEAFGECLDDLPRTPEFERLIVNYVPEHTLQQTVWFARLLMAATVGGADLALWTARCRQSSLLSVKSHRWIWLAAYAWYSRNPGTLAHTLIRRPFAPAMSYPRAYEEIEVWNHRLHLPLALGEGQRTWCRRGRAHGYDFVPLTDVPSYLAESLQMENCLDRFGGRLLSQPACVLSVRRGGKVVADVEVATHELDASVPRIAQVRGPANQPAEQKVWLAAHAWLSRQALPPLAPGRPCFAPRPQRERDASARELWRPFLAALRTDQQRTSAAAALTLDTPA